jgi:hypothetical protein
VLENRDAWRSMFDNAVAAMRAHMLVDWSADAATGQVMSYVTPLSVGLCTLNQVDP